MDRQPATLSKTFHLWSVYCLQNLELLLSRPCVGHGLRTSNQLDLNSSSAFIIPTNWCLQISIFLHPHSETFSKFSQHVARGRNCTSHHRVQLFYIWQYIYACVQGNPIKSSLVRTAWRVRLLQCWVLVKVNTWWFAISHYCSKSTFIHNK